MKYMHERKTLASEKKTETQGMVALNPVSSQVPGFHLSQEQTAVPGLKSLEFSCNLIINPFSFYLSLYPFKVLRL